MTITVNFFMLRVQVRCPSPPSLPRRSGALILDVQEICMTNADQTPSLRFVDSRARSDRYLIECRRIVVACSKVTENKAVAVLSAGPLAQAEVSGQSQSYPKPAFSDARTPTPALSPRFVVSKGTTGSRPSDDPQPTLRLNIVVPSLHIILSKPLLDCLQYWADDVAQLLEGTLNRDSDTEQQETKDESLIGSRFFAKSLRSKTSGSGSGSIVKNNNEGNCVVDANISEGFGPL
jgi:autophagy-related protein 2